VIAEQLSDGVIERLSSDIESELAYDAVLDRLRETRSALLDAVEE